MGIEDNEKFCTMYVKATCTGENDLQCHKDAIEKCKSWSEGTDIGKYTTDLKKEIRLQLKTKIMDDISSYSEKQEIFHDPIDEFSQITRNILDLEPKKPQHQEMPSSAGDTSIPAEMTKVHTHEHKHVGEYQIAIPDSRKALASSALLSKPEQPFPNTRIQGIPTYENARALPDIEIEKLCMDYLKRK
mgnify:CR=1 FL=1